MKTDQKAEQFVSMIKHRIKSLHIISVYDINTHKCNC